MAQPPESTAKKPFRIFLVLVAVVVLGVFLSAAGFAYAATQESHDPFCGSCHTQPESTYLQQAESAQDASLASYHAAQSTRCIDCHSGRGILGRMQAELMGARNAFKWYTGTAVQPAVLTSPIGGGNCLKCHDQVTRRGYTPKKQFSLPGLRIEEEEGEEGGSNHWHEQFSRWQAVSAAASCVGCHAGHAEGLDAELGYLDSRSVQAGCDACHRLLGERD